jgi:predicted HicB family RNase H-like nuclease
MTKEKPRQRSKVQVKFRVPTATHQALSAIAAAKGVSLTDVINRAVRAFVDDAKGRKAA